MAFHVYQCLLVFISAFRVVTNYSIHSKYRSWRITGALPWAGLLFVAGFAMHIVSAYKDHDLGIFIAAVVLLLVAPSVGSIRHSASAS